MVRGLGMEKALKVATEFTCMAIENTAQNRPEMWYGVNFEGVLCKLPDMLKDE